MGRYTAVQYERKLQRWAKKSPEAAKEALEKGTALVAREAKQKHLSGPRMPVGIGSESKPTINSRGALRSGITTKVKLDSKKNVQASIISKHPLSRIHHDGALLTAREQFVFTLPGRQDEVITRQVRMPARPFLRAPVQKNRPKILQMIAKKWKGKL